MQSRAAIRYAKAMYDFANEENFINEVYKIKQSIIIIVYSFFVGLVWAQTSLNTSLLSNGIFFGILLMLFVPKEQNLKKSEI